MARGWANADGRLPDVARIRRPLSVVRPDLHAIWLVQRISVREFPRRAILRLTGTRIGKRRLLRSHTWRCSLDRRIRFLRHCSPDLPSIPKPRRAWRLAMRVG